MTATLRELFTATIQRHVADDARLVAYSERPLARQGYSGATIRIYDVQWEARGEQRTIALATKDALAVERRVLVLLAEQGHANVPYAWSLAATDEKRALLCMRAVAPDAVVDEGVWKRTAVALAGIHAANLGQRDRLGWLPPADAAYMNGGYVLDNWRTVWALAMQDAEFADHYGSSGTALWNAADRFLRDMEALWEAGDTLTLIHGDLHAGNVLVEAGTPFVIDWEQTLYGTLFYDLPNYLTLAQSQLYRDVLLERGYAIPRDAFERGYLAASRMIGFKYIGFWLEHWRRGGADRERSRAPIQVLIDTAINGKH